MKTHLQLIHTRVVQLEKIRVIQSEAEWKEIREIRNQINHEYEDDPEALSLIIQAMAACVPILLAWQENARNYCVRKFGLSEFL